MATITQNQAEEPKAALKPRSFRFDIFKGVPDSTGKVHKVKSVGSSHLVDGCRTYSLYLKTFLNDVFYLLPEKTKKTDADYVILTREISKNPSRKYFWNSVGSGVLLQGENSGIIKLSWDMLGCEDIFMNLYPRNTSGE